MGPHSLTLLTTKKMKFSIKDFFSKSLLQIWWHLLKKSFKENLIVCTVAFDQIWELKNLEELMESKLFLIQKWIMAVCFHYSRKKNLLFKFLGVLIGVLISWYTGLFQKWSTLDPNNFYAIPFQKLVFLVSLHPEFLEKKKQRNKKKLTFGQFSLFLFRRPC